MAVAFSVRNDANFLSGLSAVSASITFASGRLYAANVLQLKSASGPTVPSSVAGATMTFQRVVGADVTATPSAFARSSLWVAVGNGNTEAVTISFAESEDDGFYDISEYTGSKTTNGGLGAIVQAVPGSGSGANPSINLAALQDSGSMAVGSFLWQPNQAATVGAGFTVIAGFGHASPLSFKQADEYQANVTTVNITAAANPWLGVAYEIAVAGAADPKRTFDPVPFYPIPSKPS